MSLFRNSLIDCAFSDINGTRIVPIPKVSNPNLMSHFRPISFCNIMYKISEKMLVNRF